MVNSGTSLFFAEKEEIRSIPKLAAGDFEAKAGSTVVTLKAAALEKLSAGSRTVTANFDDSSNMGLWIAVMVLTVTALCVAALIGKKRSYTGRQ